MIDWGFNVDTEVRENTRSQIIAKYVDTYSNGENAITKDGLYFYNFALIDSITKSIEIGMKVIENTYKIEKNKKKLFSTNRNADFVEAIMEFGALVCKPKDPICHVCCLNKTCKYFKSNLKIKQLWKRR